MQHVKISNIEKDDVEFYFINLLMLFKGFSHPYILLVEVLVYLRMVYLLPYGLFWSGFFPIPNLYSLSVVLLSTWQTWHMCC